MSAGALFDGVKRGTCTVSGGGAVEAATWKAASRVGCDKARDEYDSSCSLASRCGRGACAEAEGWPSCRDACVSRCDRRGRVECQTCRRWLCSAAMSGMGTLPRLLSPREAIARGGEQHETSTVSQAWSVVLDRIASSFQAIVALAVLTNMTRAPVRLCANASTLAEPTLHHLCKPPTTRPLQRHRT